MPEFIQPILRERYELLDLRLDLARNAILRRSDLARRDEFVALHHQMVNMHDPTLEERTDAFIVQHARQTWKIRSAA